MWGLFKPILNISNQCRYIHNPIYIPKDTDQLVVIGNNSLMFATIQALKLHGSDVYPKMTFIYPTFWLDKVNMQSYGQLDWGQNILGFPRVVRETFATYRRGYPLNKFVTWYDYQQVRLQAKNLLKNHNKIEFVEGNLLELTEINNRYKIALENKQIIEVPKKSFFYFWFREARLTSFITRAHTSLYELPINEIPDTIIVVGHGLSFKWIVRDFPNKKIINIKREGEKLPDTPATRHIDLDKEIANGRVIIYDSKDITINVSSDGFNAEIRALKNNNVLQEGDIFAATGLIPNHKFTDCIPDKQKLLMPIIGSDGNIIAPRDEETFRLFSDLFKAPENIPLGSLSHSFTHLMEITKNITWTSEPMMYYSKSQYERLRQFSALGGIELKLEFFNILDNIIEGYDNPLDFNQSINLYLSIYKNIHKATDAEVALFETILVKFFQALPKNMNPENQGRSLLKIT